MTAVVSADWVLPVEGVPIADGAVAIEDGRITAVGTARELGEGKRYLDAVIAPGFVNSHSHLEYAVYGGFGDGLGDFAEWITLHIQRKARIGWDEFIDVARLGAAECLASGVTTIGDCSYSGATAIAADELGLRATVYLTSPRFATGPSLPSPTGSGPASRRTRRTPSRSSSTRLARSWVCRSRRTSRKARRR
jgi:aminodeoxyfutalosine deaminase